MEAGIVSRPIGSRAIPSENVRKDVFVKEFPRWEDEQFADKGQKKPLAGQNSDNDLMLIFGNASDKRKVS